MLGLTFWVWEVRACPGTLDSVNGGDDYPGVASVSADFVSISFSRDIFFLYCIVVLSSSANPTTQSVSQSENGVVSRSGRWRGISNIATFQRYWILKSEDKIFL